MELAVVRGQCTATVKDSSLTGRRFALVQRVTADGLPEGAVEAALDVTSAAIGQMVLLTRGSAARLPASTRQLATDLTVVAIVDDLQIDDAPSPRPGRTRARSSSTTSGGK